MFAKHHPSAASQFRLTAEHHDHQPNFWFLVLGCVGVVYGDIGTSPLYAFRQAITLVAGNGIHEADVFGILSLIIWALMLIVTLKYVMFLLHADNRGEGGILSLMAQAQKAVEHGPGLVFLMGAIGAALFYGDASITPAISVLSAVEGLNVATPSLSHLVLPISVFILIVLFMSQKYGTAKISALFGPVTAIWFLAIGAAGIACIAHHPRILLSVNPYYAAYFLAHHGEISLAVLGAVFLAVTGAEALYADLGHFGRTPIQTAWLGLVFPCLLLNYMGQGALVLGNAKAVENPFYLMMPHQFLMPMIVLATLATIIASQAVITGAYSLTRQAIQLGLLPRMEIRHTSSGHEGQIYMPRINRLLLAAVLMLCAVFKGSDALASAYGIAVTGTMIVTSVLAFIVVRKVWGRSVLFSAALILPFFAAEIVFLAANMTKLMDGGIVPLMMAGFLLLIMIVWVNGTRYLRVMEKRHTVPLTALIAKLKEDPPARVPGTAIFLARDSQSAPPALVQNLKYNKVLHEKNIILTVVTLRVPKAAESQRVVVDALSPDITSVILSFGYMETPDVPRALAFARTHGLEIDMEHAFFFMGRRSVVADAKRGLPEWQDHIYIALARGAASAPDFFRLPPNKVMEVGQLVAV